MQDEELERSLIETMSTKAGRHAMWWVLHGPACAVGAIPTHADGTSLALMTGRHLAGDTIKREIERLAPLQAILMNEEALQRARYEAEKKLRKNMESKA